MFKSNFVKWTIFDIVSIFMIISFFPVVLYDMYKNYISNIVSLNDLPTISYAIVCMVPIVYWIWFFRLIKGLGPVKERKENKKPYYYLTAEDKNGLFFAMVIASLYFMLKGMEILAYANDEMELAILFLGVAIAIPIYFLIRVKGIPYETFKEHGHQ